MLSATLKLNSTKVPVLLCNPTTVEDVQQLFELFHDPNHVVDKSKIPLLGNITHAAVYKCHLMIVMTNQPIFIHFDLVSGILDEVYLNKPCSFSLLADKRYEFSCSTSTEYLQWIKALTEAFEVAGCSYNDRNKEP
jgi:hypothetical protein